jgi:hypothetical protein
LATECHPCINQTVPPPTRNTSPCTSLASSLASQATSGATLRGSKTSNSPSFAWPMRAAVDGVASTVRRVRATGAMALQVTPYFAISMSIVTAISATAAFAAP